MKKLTLFTLLYIASPTPVFLIFWLKPLYAIITCIGLTMAFTMAVAHLKGHTETISRQKITATLLSSAALALVIGLMSEFGAVGYQSFDYQMHNYKLNLLATSALPLYNKSRDVYMCYYLGFYMIPALLGKFLSLAAIKPLFFLWCWIGLTLSFAWIQLKVIDLPFKKRILICLAMLIGSYVSVIFPALKLIFPDLPVESGNSLSAGGNFVLNQVPAFTRGLSESPQHTLPAILGTCFMLAVWNKSSFFFALSIFFLATLFLTPFASIGLFAFLFTAFVRNILRDGWPFLRRFLIFAVPLAVAFLPVALFLTSSQATHMDSNRAIWQTGTASWFLYYGLYLLAAYGIWILFFGKELFLLSPGATIVATVFLFQMGFYNDLHIRSTIVPQIVFGISIAYLIVARFDLMLKKKLLTIGLLFWCVNSISPVKFFYDRLFVLKGTRNSIEKPQLTGLDSDYYDALEHAYRGNAEEVVKQYSMRKGTFFEKYLLAKNE